MDGSTWQTLVVALSAVAMSLGAAAMVLVGRWQRAGRQQAAQDVDAVLRDLATAFGGELVAGKLLTRAVRTGTSGWGCSDPES